MYHAGNRLTVKVNLRGVNTWWRYFRIETARRKKKERKRERERECVKWEIGVRNECERRANFLRGE